MLVQWMHCHALWGSRGRVRICYRHSFQCGALDAFNEDNRWRRELSFDVSTTIYVEFECQSITRDPEIAFFLATIHVGKLLEDNRPDGSVCNFGENEFRVESSANEIGIWC